MTLWLLRCGHIMLALELRGAGSIPMGSVPWDDNKYSFCNAMQLTANATWAKSIINHNRKLIGPQITILYLHDSTRSSYFEIFVCHFQKIFQNVARR